MTKNIMIVGVGGQGTLLASRILGNAVIGEGYDVKVSEVHGMSQRGGSVVTYVKYGDKVYSPVIDEGDADIILAFELLEAYRALPYLKKGGKIVVNDQRIDPMPVITGAMQYPEEIAEKLKAKADCKVVDALALAKENAAANDADVLFIQSDMFTRIRGRFDIIVTNPPYIPSKDIDGLQREVKDHEPRLALDGGEDGMDFYRRIAAEAGKYLNRGGMLIMEVGAGEAQDVVKMFKGVAYSMVVRDFNGIDRYVKIVL